MKNLSMVLILGALLSACSTNKTPRPSAQSQPPVVQEQQQQQAESGQLSIQGNSFSYIEENQHFLQKMVNDILAAEQQYFNCGQLFELHAQITSQSDTLIEETWTVNACNVAHQYRVQFIAGANGPDYSLSLMTKP